MVIAQGRQLGFTGSQALVAALLLGVVAALVLPLPTALLDLLLATNLVFSLFVVITVALYLEDSLKFASFSSLLLLSTLFRLTLNVSSTRLILSDADAGQVIGTFGRLVVGGDYLVGSVIFVMITLVQFAVIARGAERVAEVAARFALDALPGKQLAIDAEQRRGQLSRAAAQRLRERLDQQGQFYGAMDGAMKFVRGDAVVSIAITLVNLLAGVGIGTLSRGLDFDEALRHYGLLTVGDGLVSQLPALLLSTAAGLVVTRVTTQSRSSLAADLIQQLSAHPQGLATAALFALGLAAVPGFPAWAFVGLALALGLVALNAHRAGQLPCSPALDSPLTLDALQQRLDLLMEERPTLLAHTVPHPYPLPRLLSLIQALVAEGMPSTWLPELLESLAQKAPEQNDHDLLEAVRRDLGPRLSEHLLGRDTLKVLRLSPSAEEALLDARVQDGETSWLAVEPSLADELASDLKSHRTTSTRLALLVGPALRRPLWQLLAPRLPELTVFSPHELPSQAEVQVVGQLGP